VAADADGDSVIDIIGSNFGVLLFEQVPAPTLTTAGGSESYVLLEQLGQATEFRFQYDQ
jgi:hypothetical protein